MAIITSTMGGTHTAPACEILAIQAGPIGDIAITGAADFTLRTFDGPSWGFTGIHTFGCNAMTTRGQFGAEPVSRTPQALRITSIR